VSGQTQNFSRVVFSALGLFDALDFLLWLDGRAGLLSNNSLELLFRRTAAKMALRMVTDKIMGFAAKQYQNVLGNQLAQYGLRYEDILIEEEREVKEALSLADPDVLTGRTRRLKRAIDLNYKRKSLQDYAPNMELDLFKREIYPDIEKIRARDQEYAQLNSHNKQ